MSLVSGSVAYNLELESGMWDLEAECTGTALESGAVVSAWYSGRPGIDSRSSDF